MSHFVIIVVRSLSSLWADSFLMRCGLTLEPDLTLIIFLRGIGFSLKLMLTFTR